MSMNPNPLCARTHALTWLETYVWMRSIQLSPHHFPNWTIAAQLRWVLLDKIRAAARGG